MLGGERMSGLTCGVDGSIGRNSHGVRGRAAVECEVHGLDVALLEGNRSSGGRGNEAKAGNEGCSELHVCGSSC